MTLCYRGRLLVGWQVFVGKFLRQHHSPSVETRRLAATVCEESRMLFVFGCDIITISFVKTAVFKILRGLVFGFPLRIESLHVAASLTPN